MSSQPTDGGCAAWLASRVARTELAGYGADVSEVFHDMGGVFHHAGTEGRALGPDPQRRSYASFASFSDPDGNGWLFQEITKSLSTEA